MSVEWKCAGCGKPSPERVRSCDCPTEVVYAEGHKSAWKRNEAIEAQAERELRRGFWSWRDKYNPTTEQQADVLGRMLAEITKT